MHYVHGTFKQNWTFADFSLNTFSYKSSPLENALKKQQFSGSTGLSTTHQLFA